VKFVIIRVIRVTESESDEKEDLVEDEKDIDGSECDDGCLCQSEFAVETQKHQTGGSDKELPDPEQLSMKLHNRANNRVGLPSPVVDNH